MALDSQTRFWLEYDPRLVEEAVLLSLEGHREETQFRRERDRVYELANEDERETRFSQLHGKWFVQLQLGRPIVEALEEQPGVIQQAQRCAVLPAITSRDEGADLHDWLGGGGGQPTAILMKLKPRRLLDTTELRGWLRHELMHIADMLDPNFGYERLIPASDLGPAYANLLRDRYRVLWDTWIDGRLHRRGWLPQQVREKRLAEFVSTFAMMGPEAEEKFQQLFESPSQTHTGLMTLAQRPAEHAAATPRSAPHSQICPLCRFPTFQLVRNETELSQDVLEEIAADFPHWQSEQGLCGQCAELYGARKQSRAAEAALPGI
ncbi:MAG: hypothetical protein HY649_04910 [Acidobacteria bacterium]|nr:hypothetical protein [Acidobacteriota bacterium]